MDTKQLLQRGLILEYITLGWNVVGCAVAVWAGIEAASLALFGFGIDSAIEIFASVVVLWQLHATHKDNEKLALKLIGSAFMLLSLYLLVRSVQVLMEQVHPQTSIIGGVWLVITALAMFSLAYGKRIVGTQLKNAILLEESVVTLVDGFLAVAILAGVILNAAVGWWWADATASLVAGLDQAIQLKAAQKKADAARNEAPVLPQAIDIPRSGAMPTADPVPTPGTPAR